ncbi:cadherin-13 [Cricetulus griseus]|nr:cadherin-13 [Cricetulus griseus]
MSGREESVARHTVRIKCSTLQQGQGGTIIISKQEKVLMGGGVPEAPGYIVSTIKEQRGQGKGEEREGPSAFTSTTRPIDLALLFSKILEFVLDPSTSSKVLLVTSADDLDCTPGFQQKVLHIQQPAEFIEDQPVLNFFDC